MDVAGLISLLESADIQAGREVKELVLDNLRNSMHLYCDIFLNLNFNCEYKFVLIWFVCTF